jgi:ribosome-associated protein
MASRIIRKTADSKADSKINVLPLVRALVKALDAKKAGDLRVLYVGENSTITDYIVIASGQANPHLRALRIELERVLDDAGAPIAGIETSEGSGWLVFDAYQIMIHLFMPEQREVYQLEQLWQDGEELNVAEILAPVAATPQPKVSVAAAAKTVKKVAKKKPTAAAKKIASKKSTAVNPVTKKIAVSKVAVKKVTVKKTAVKKVAVKKTEPKTIKKKLS